MAAKAIYIAGPMRGYLRFNVDAFDKAAIRWQGLGWITVNPCDFDRIAGFDFDILPQDITQDDKRQFMRRDLLAIINDCCAIALLPGWEKSVGVKVELALAQFLGLEIYDAVSGAKIDDPYAAKVDPEPVLKTDKLALGVPFLGSNRAICEEAEEAQRNGAKFEYRRTRNAKWASSDVMKFLVGYQYRMVATAPVPVSTLDPRFEFRVAGDDCPVRAEALRLQDAGARFEYCYDEGEWVLAESRLEFREGRYSYAMVSLPPSPESTIEPGEEFGPDKFELAKRMQDAGAVFEFYNVPHSDWRPAWDCKFKDPNNRYRRKPRNGNPDENILAEAMRITAGDRQASYGPPDQDFARTAAMWSAVKGVEFEAREVALFMILLKVSRETHQRKRDNWVDIAGYAKCGSVCR